MFYVTCSYILANIICTSNNLKENVNIIVIIACKGYIADFLLSSDKQNAVKLSCLEVLVVANADHA